MIDLRADDNLPTVIPFPELNRRRLQLNHAHHFQFRIKFLMLILAYCRIYLDQVSHHNQEAHLFHFAQLLQVLVCHALKIQERGKYNIHYQSICHNPQILSLIHI